MFSLNPEDTSYIANHGLERKGSLTRVGDHPAPGDIIYAPDRLLPTHALWLLHWAGREDQGISPALVADEIFSRREEGLCREDVHSRPLAIVVCFPSNPNGASRPGDLSVLMKRFVANRKRQ